MIRGNERKNIFHDDEDKLRFIEIVHEKQQADRFFLHAFCLMDNHVHLMLSEGNEDLAKVMKRISVSYVYYFNKKYRRVGHLFQDRFKSEVVEDEGYVLALARYIHQNPVKAGIVNSADKYKWSSFSCYANEDNYFAGMLDTEIIFGLFSKDKLTAKRQFITYMNAKTDEEFIDIKEESGEIDEGMTQELFEEILLNHGITRKGNSMVNLPDIIIKEFREKSNLSIRKIAVITGMNKDRINRILKSKT